MAKKPPRIVIGVVRNWKREPWAGRTAQQRKITGRALQRARAALFAREPLCRLCSYKGRVSWATIRDHITPLAEGGEDVDSNIQPLCGDCHKLKTQEESRRGAIRARQLR